MQVKDAKGRRYDTAVLVAGLAANPDVYRVGFGKPLDQIGATWVKAIASPIPPNVVTAAPCQEIVITGDNLDRDGNALDGLPVPISTPGWDNAPYLSAGHYITKDPDTGIQNVGNYRGQFKAPRRLGMNPSVELRAGIFAHTLIDAHVYTKKPDGSMAEYDHVPGLELQLTRRRRGLRLRNRVQGGAGRNVLGAASLRRQRRPRTQ